MRALETIQADCRRVADALTVCGKRDAALHLRRTEYDLLLRLPREAGTHGFNVSEDGAITFHGRAVRRIAAPSESDRTRSDPNGSE